MNYTMMLLAQRLEELEQKLLESNSMVNQAAIVHELAHVCLLYTSDAADD